MLTKSHLGPQLMIYVIVIDIEGLESLWIISLICLFCKVDD